MARITVDLLSSQSFAAFGDVITSPSQSSESPGTPAVGANQGTAMKYEDVSKMQNLYGRAPSRKTARLTINTFVCSPRPVTPDANTPSESRDGLVEGLLPISVLERHPFTGQTFLPLGLAPSDPHTRYLVVVAPTLPASRSEDPRPPPFPPPPPRPRRSLREVLSLARPPPFPEPASPRTLSSPKPVPLPLLGRPDVGKARAFLADGSQAVTYRAGTWHSPMIVLGSKPIDFVVLQHVNGVAQEDCQEVEITSDETGEGLSVVVSGIARAELSTSGGHGKSKL
ncbi:MAG: Ureidoglycolate lyase [Thelocarpon superellum]|nr:MAG: Ureidoglycolate lyase [Thelocarpon superellum]